MPEVHTGLTLANQGGQERKLLFGAAIILWIAAFF